MRTFLTSLTLVLVGGLYAQAQDPGMQAAQAAQMAVQQAQMAAQIA